MKITCDCCSELGKIRKPNANSPWTKIPCPTCKGKGEMRLAVKCNCHNGRRGVGCFDYHVDSYHPLSDVEVNALIARHKPSPHSTTQYDPVELMISNIKDGKLEYKGMSVKLIPEEG